MRGGVKAAKVWSPQAYGIRSHPPPCLTPQNASQKWGFPALCRSMADCIQRLREPGIGSGARGYEYFLPEPHVRTLAVSVRGWSIQSE